MPLRCFAQQRTGAWIKQTTRTYPEVLKTLANVIDGALVQIVPTRRVPEATMEALKRWSWPGNIRELENFLERAVILTRGSALYIPVAELEIEAEEPDPSIKTSTHKAAEREHILRALRAAKGLIAGANGAAARLGLKRTTLNSKIEKLGIERSDYI